MKNFNILDHIRDGGSPDNSKANDDWLGFDKRVAVIGDGATGLSDERFIAEADSDAQWIAKLAVEHLLGARADDPVRELVREINMHAHSVIFAEKAPDTVPKYAWPTSSFIMARLQVGQVEISSLGDCLAFVEMTDGYIQRFSALPFNRGNESRDAHRDLMKRSSQSGEAIRSPEVVQSLRNKREKLNTLESGIWTLGLVPQAADHVFTVAIPSTEIKSILLMSDGFSSIVDSYQKYDERTLLERARSTGLAQINAEIRRIERIIDPMAKQFPRYKQSDDSSAILLELIK